LGVSALSVFTWLGPNSLVPILTAVAFGQPMHMQTRLEVNPHPGQIFFYNFGNYFGYVLVVKTKWNWTKRSGTASFDKKKHS